MDEGAEEDAGGRTAAETGPAKSSAHVQWRLGLLQESDADDYSQPICLRLTRHARISGEILIIARSVAHLVIPTTCTSSFPMIGLPSLEKGMIPAHVLSISRSRRSGNTSEACSLLAVTLSERILGI